MYRTRSRSKPTTLEEINMDTNELKTLITSLIQGLSTTIQTNATMMVESFKNLELKLEGRIANLELKVDKNLVHVTDTTSELKDLIDNNVTRIDSEIFDLQTDKQKLQD